MFTKSKFLNTSEIFYENEERFSQKLATFAQIMGILNNTFKPTLFQQYSRIKVYNVLALPLFYMEAKFVPLDKRIRND